MSSVLNPTFFGDPKSPLFGAYHPPAAGVPAGRGVVLCHPLGHEYFKAYRAFRLLADQLARAGLHVWRFDYFGTGDSAGGSEEGDVDVWIGNIALAMRELRTVAGVPCTALVGLRFGAMLAVEAAVRNEGVERLVLWDPILTGAAYLEELESVAVALEEASRRPREVDPDTLTVVGCHFSSHLREQIGALDLLRALNAYRGQVFTVFDRQSTADDLRSALNGTGRIAASELLPDPRSWASPDQEPFIPQPAIQWITQRLREARS